MKIKSEQKFEIGNLYITSGVAKEIKKDTNYLAKVFNSLLRYINCDWGDLDNEDKIANEQALKYEERLLGRYNIKPKPIYIITEWDRSATTILFPKEY